MRIARSLAIAAAIAATSFSVVAPLHAQAAPAASSAIDQAVAGAWRTPKEKARDTYRHPAQTLAFFGIAPTQTVIEVTPGGGWYTHILAPLLNAHGHYIGAEAKPSAGGEAPSDDSTLRKIIAGDPTHFGNAKVVQYDPSAPVLGPANSADRVLTFRNVHNWTDAGNATAMFQAFFKVLKPGGVLGVVDHRAKAGSTIDAVKDSGYLPTDYVVKLATDAGFKQDGQSEINANPKDTKDYPKGVWTLPPTLTLKATDKAKYQAIGESDRMTLRFVKPK